MASATEQQRTSDVRAGLTRAQQQPAERWPRPAGTLERVLEDLVSWLEREGVRHAFLRGQRDFPRVPEGSDVDLLVEPDQAARLERALGEICARRGAVLWQRFRAGFLRQLYLYAFEGPGRHAFLEIDVHTAEACFGVPFLSARRLLAARTALPPRALPEDLSALVDFLGPFLSGGAVLPRYARRLRAVAEGDAARLVQTLGELVGARRGEELLRGILAGDAGELARQARRFRRALLARAFLRRPLRSAVELARFGAGARLRPLFSPRGKLVALLGTDGAGKTTLLRGLEARLAAVFRGGRSRTFHLRPGLLPQLDALVHLGRPTARPEDFERPHRARPSGTLVSALRSTYYALDYVLGHALRVSPLRRRASLVLFDRYFDDQLVDPRRYRLQRAGAWQRFLARRVPRPDVVLVCTASPEAIQERKRELPPEETERQVRAYERLAAERADQGFHLIDTGRGEEAALDLAIQAIFAGSSP